MLNKVKTTIEYRMTIEEAVELNELIELRTPKKGEYYEPTLNKCPNCKKLFYKDHKFCTECGQRVVFTSIKELDYIPFDKDYGEA